MSKYFKPEETKCHCSCGINNVNPLLLIMLDNMREAFGKPIILACACRCPKHNKEVGGKPDSAHISTTNEQCEAADIQCLDSYTRYELVGIAYRLGIKRMEVGKTWIHIDIDRNKPQRVMFLPD